jgi:4-amino-4-deoxy-L-arabinose transferase-like glycosyltransferase
VTSRSLLLLFAVFSISTLSTLGLRPLYKADESRYAEIPREMVARGDWLTPRLNDLKYFEKPPLQYWATAAFFSVFGERDWAARLWTALTAIAGVFLVFFSGKRLFSPQAGALGAAVLAGCPLYAMLGQINTLDMALAFFLSAAIFAFALGRYYLFWAACALAVLSKGLIGIVLPAGAIFFYVVLKRDWRLLAKMKIFSGSLLFLAICAPWFVAVSLANPEFAHFFFVQEHFQRFTTKMHGRYQPMWFFLPILFFGIAPWILPFAGMLKSIFRKREKTDPAFDPASFLWIWIVLVFVFFSVSGSKLPSYILPVFPALALLIGRYLSEAQPRRLLVIQAVLASVVGAGVVVTAPQTPGFFVSELAPLAADYVVPLIIAGAALTAFSLAGIVAAAYGHTGRAVALLAAGSFSCTLIALSGHASLSANYSIAGQAGAIDPQAPVFAVDFYDHTLPWYLRRPVTMVRYKDELEVAIKWEPHKFVPDLPAFAREWAVAPAAFAVFSSANFENIRKESGIAAEIVSRGPRYTIVRKP